MQRHLQPAVDRFKAIEDEDKREEFREKLGGYVKIYAFLSQIIPYADPDLEMLYSYGRFLLPHLPLDRDTTIDQGRRRGGACSTTGWSASSRARSTLKEGEAQYVKSPTDVGTGKAKDEKVPLSEIIEVLNERFGTSSPRKTASSSSRSRRRPAKNEQVIQTALANPLDKFELGIRKLIEDLMIERMAENDKIVTRYMDDREFQSAAFPILAREIFDAVRAQASEKNRAAGR